MFMGAAAPRFYLAGKMRVNLIPTAKPHHPVRPGDVSTFAAPGGRLCVVRVLVLEHRRGPGAEARGFYEDLGDPGAVAPKCTTG